MTSWLTNSFFSLFLKERESPPLVIMSKFWSDGSAEYEHTAVKYVLEDELIAQGCGRSF